MVEHYLPSLSESNEAILSKSGLDEFKIKRMIKKIGIKSRRIADKNVFSNDLGIRAAKKVLSSDLGKAAIAGAAFYYGGGGAGFGGKSMFGNTGFGKAGFMNNLGRIGGSLADVFA